jgi:hypothetical protein
MEENLRRASKLAVEIVAFVLTGPQITAIERFATTSRFRHPDLLIVMAVWRRREAHFGMS